MAIMKKSAEKSVKNNHTYSSDGPGITEINAAQYDVFDDEEVYNMHERYEEESSAPRKPDNRKRSFRNGNSGRGAELKK